MPQVYKVQKARKEQGQCGRCGCKIKKGDPYVYWGFRVAYGSSWGTDRRIRCTKPECSPKPKDLTRSEFWGAIYELQERSFEGESVDDIESARDDVVGELENIKSEVEDKLNNMPEGLQQGDTGQMLQERIDALDECINNLESADISIDDGDEDETEEAKAARIKDRLQEIADELSSHLSDISCS